MNFDNYNSLFYSINDVITQNTIKNKEDTSSSNETILTNEEYKLFIEKTNNKKILIDSGYSRKYMSPHNKYKRYYNYTLSKELENKNITFLLKNGIKKYIKQLYNITIVRYTDETYIVEYMNGIKHLFSLKKFTHNDNYYDENELWSILSYKKELEIQLQTKYIIHYGITLSNFIYNKLNSEEPRYVILKQIYKENNITVFNGESNDYFTNLHNWYDYSI